ncbi:hypothetical protein SPBR_03810 [Sporothrix brasiliensis 5110]|uniref:DUF7924 domain-containing protein n=1 Tax=Sporothrix brasiliensis 5110 TaxID=1398154 RepID=A0A0C2F7C4_9PEZI|nr:uncharacterized protein SPBR_03810 [Sporothrix brasiliensis 5110]KIH94864.1 hypothetical protein SPBR_03810 [Sporothrix brasiliensis 5110]
MANDRAKNEAEVTTFVIPTILGPYQPDHPSALQTGFNNLQPLTDGTIAPPQPDIYYGADPGELARPVRDTLSHYIMPSTTEDRPWVPNFSVEVKGPNGRPAVATKQARYYGATGSRAMYSLQNYGEEEPEYDGKAYTYSSTYHDGTLKLYAHHPTAPTEEKGRPEYHMSQIRTFGMTDTRDTFVQGATAFRNTRDLAKRHRDSFIQAANARASQEDPAIDHSLWLDGDEELQQAIADANGYDVRDGDEATASHQPLYTGGDLEDPSQDSVALGDGLSVSGFTSSFTSSVSSAKRLKEPVSPPSRSKGSRSSKSHKRSRK